jgi:hypothetical protein
VTRNPKHDIDWWLVVLALAAAVTFWVMLRG